MTVVIGVDGSERSEPAIAFGGRLAAASGAHVVVACAFPAAQAYAPLRDAALDTAVAATKRLEQVPARRVSIRAVPGSPAQGLHEVAVAERASLIVLGSTGTGRFGRLHRGSTAEQLLQVAPCPVAVVPRRPGPVARIGVAYDDSPEARAALASAKALARDFGAELELIAVAARDELEQQVRAAAGEHPLTVLRDGDPAAHLTARSGELDLLVTGSRGYQPLRAVLARGVSGRLIHRASCPVIVVPRTATA